MTNQKTTYTVPSDERIIAQNGDMIAAVTFDGTNDPKLHSTGSAGIVFKYRPFYPPWLTPGMILTTTNTFEATYSLSVATSTEPKVSGNHANIIK